MELTMESVVTNEYGSNSKGISTMKFHRIGKEREQAISSPEQWPTIRFLFHSGNTWIQVFGRR